MFNLLDDPFADLCTTRNVLVEVRYAFYLVHDNIRKTFPSLAFAAKLNVDSRSDLLRSLDDVCFERIRQATKYTMETGFRFTDYEADRYVVWMGLDDSKLPLSTLSDREVEAQLEMMERRGCRDRIRVHMAIEVDGSEAGRDGEGGGEGSIKSVQTEYGVCGNCRTARRLSEVSLHQ